MVGDLVMNVGGGEHGMVQVAEPFIVESSYDGADTSSDAAESQRISSFSVHGSPKRAEFA